MSEIYLHLNGIQSGPHQPEEVRRMLADGKITNDTPAWIQELPDWSTVGKVLLPPIPLVPGMPPPPPSPAPQKKGVSGCIIALAIVGGIFLLIVPILAGIALGPITRGIKQAKESAGMQTARTIALAMFAYSNDHNGQYPPGQTSTEVFQKLIDENYITDPAIFYLPMPGKVKPTSKQLTAENVSFDVTAGATMQSPEGVPLVFCTGYVVTYGDHPTAVPNSSTPYEKDGMAMAFTGFSSKFIRSSSDGSIDLGKYQPNQETYRQLKP